MKSSDNLDQERVDELLGALAKLASRGIGSVAKTGAKASSKLGQLGADADARRDARKRRKQNLKDRKAVARDAKKKLASGNFSDSDALELADKKRKLARERIAARGITLKSDKKNPNRVKKGDLGNNKITFDPETMTTTSTPARTAREKFDVAMRKRRAKKRLTMGTEVDGDQISEAKKKVEDENNSNFDLGSESISPTTDRTPDPSKKTYSNDDYIPNPTLTPEDRLRFGRLRKKAYKKASSKARGENRIARLKSELDAERKKASDERERRARPEALEKLQGAVKTGKMYRDLGVDPSDADVEQRTQEALPGIEAEIRKNHDRFYGSKKRKDAAKDAIKLQDKIDKQRKVMALGQTEIVPSEILPTPPESKDADFALNTAQSKVVVSDPKGRGRESQVSRKAVKRGREDVTRRAVQAMNLKNMGPHHPDIYNTDKDNWEGTPEDVLRQMAEIPKHNPRPKFGGMSNTPLARKLRARAVHSRKTRNLQNVYNRPKGKLGVMRGDGTIGEPPKRVDRTKEYRGRFSTPGFTTEVERTGGLDPERLKKLRSAYKLMGNLGK